MKTSRISSGESIVMEVLKIRSIPHISIVQKSAEQDADMVVAAYAREMTSTLGEIYQFYKTELEKNHRSKDIAIEFLWNTTAVEDQPYKASINLYLAVRAIDRREEEAQRIVQLVKDAICASLSAGKYEFTAGAFEEYADSMQHLRQVEVRAISKDDRVENLQNQCMPYSFAYDMFPTDFGEMSRLVSALIQYPGVAVAFQLMPTYFELAELRELEQLEQNLSMLSKGINDHIIGSVSISVADKLVSLYKYYSDNKSRPLFLYNILVFASEDVLPLVSTRLVGQVNGDSQQSMGLRFVDFPASKLCGSEGSLFSMPWVANEMVENTDRPDSVWLSGVVHDACFRFPYIITADEATQFFRLPLASETVYAGLPVNESSRSSKTYAQHLINTGDIEIGELKSASSHTIGISLKDLAKHMLIVGTPGSGKTTFSISLLDRLWKKHHIPFLVIEPAKNEYRALVQSIPDIQVFTPGKNFISPFVYNPFVPPKNVRLETYKSTLKTAFAAGVSMSTPLDKIFEETVNNCYGDFRWLDTYTSDSAGRVFNISDFIKCFQETFDQIGYTGDARNIGRAGLVRLKSLKTLFDTYYSIPIEDLLSKPTVIELAAIENADQKALIIALLLLSILAYVNANYVGEGGLRNFILLEEAHVLLADDVHSGTESSANPSAIAQGLVKRMLAEIRSYGVGIGIADQSPRKVGIDIVALTDIKMAFRLVEATDKNILADSTSMTDVHKARLAKLKPGEAFLFFNKLEEPEEVKTPDYRLENNISISLSDQSIQHLSKYWDTRREKLRPYPECEKCPYCHNDCCYERRVLSREVARRIYNKYIGAGCGDVEKLKFVLRRISVLIKEELNDEEFSRKLLSCVKVHLWRHVRYDSKIYVAEESVNQSLSLI